VINPVTQTFIDMADCNLRGVSAVHIEYLKNMGVVASMSTRILKGDQLWGLIACHHKTVKPMSFRMCATFELLSGIISSRINSLANNQALVTINRLEDQYSKIIRKLYQTGSLVQTLLKGPPGLLDLFSAGGAAIAGHTGITRHGNTPETHEIEDLVFWLTAKQVTEVFHTTSLSELYDNAAAYKANASGMLAIPMDKQSENYLLIFRPQVIQQLNWGGDPATRINFESDMKTYHPRFSFKLWREQVVGYSSTWNDEEIQVASKLKSFIEEYLARKENNQAE
jgi:light-regulated signal transduction histidine kinase (bacteriophytochrome)